MIILTDEPLDPVAVTDSVRKDGNGAVVTFLGTTRDNFGGKTVTRLEYEAYDVMAIKKLEKCGIPSAPTTASRTSPSPTAPAGLTWATSAWWWLWPPPTGSPRSRRATRR